jgi:3-phenylpropionate/trans-cinnamate dioxygenase ferredoxin component
VTINQGDVRFLVVSPVDQLVAGERMFVEIAGKPLVIIRVGDQYFAFDDLCTHDDGPVGDGEVEGQEIVCPRHGGRFDMRTGKATGLPAVVDIQTYPVRIHQGNIEIGFSK